jgi:TRAP-type uncharacterized transport system fused permease subunit
VTVSVLAVIALAALAGAAEGWLLRKTLLWERLVLLVAGLSLLVPKPLYDAVGIALIVLVVVVQLLKRRAPALH